MPINRHPMMRHPLAQMGEEIMLFADDNKKQMDDIQIAEGVQRIYDRYMARYQVVAFLRRARRALSREMSRAVRR